MVWPAPSVSPSRLIETPPAWPVITTWKASNSFFAAASFAAAVAPAGGCAEGRIFCAAGATQTWAADAEPAASKATNRGSIFTAEPPWLAASRNGRCFPFRLANSGGLPLIAQSVCGSMPKQGRSSVERGLVRTFSYPAALLPPAGLHRPDSPRSSGLRWIRRPTGEAGDDRPDSLRSSKRLLDRLSSGRERRCEGPLYGRLGALRLGWRCSSANAAGGRRGRRAMHSLARVQTAALQPVPEMVARRWQAEKAARVAFFATALFAAQLYLSPAQWFPPLEPVHHAAIISAVGLAALMVRRVLSNEPLWMGWRTAAFAVYVVTAVLSPMWSIAPEGSMLGAFEVLKHLLFFLALVNAIDTPRRVRIALGMYALASLAPGWGTFNNWMHDELLVEGFRGRWLGVMADPNHDAMALVGALPILLYFCVGHGHKWPLRLAAAVGAVGCVAGIIATHSRGGTLGLAVAVILFALLSRRKAIATVCVLIGAAGMLLLAPTSFWQRNETAALGAEDLSIVGRLEAWQVAARIFEERPILGVGEGAFLDAWNQYAPIDSDRLFGHRYVAHNLVLEVLGTLGLVGLFGLMGFILISTWSAWKASNG